MDEQIKELTLLLLYLTSWKDNDRFEKDLHRSWKGYSFEVLDQLIEEGYIGGGYRSKSVYFTDEGVSEAQKLISKYLEQK